MSLVNNMTVDDNGGVCLIKTYHYSVYHNNVTGCTCYDVIEDIDEEVYTGEYIVPYVNKNIYYSADTSNQALCLVITPKTISDWVTEYINAIATTGYTGYSNSNRENRIIYNGENYYYIKHTTGQTTCSGDTTPKYAIIDTITDELWFSDSVNPFYYDNYGDCDIPNGDRYVRIRDINESSIEYGNTDDIMKCKNETTPILEAYNITGITLTGATLIGKIIDDGGFDILESGMCYSLYRNPTIDDYKISINPDIDNNLIAQISDLTPATYYHVRAYAKNALGISYSNVKIFVTNMF